MSSGRQRRVAATLALLSVLAMAVATLLLLADHLAARGRAHEEKARVETLVAQVQSNPVVAAQLHEERERQTQISVARNTRSQLLAWVLLFTSAVGVATGKWYMSLRPAALPHLEELVSLRLANAALNEQPTPVPCGRPEPLAQTNGDRGIDTAVVDEFVARCGDGPEAAIPILQALQSHYRYLPEEALRYLSEVTAISPAQIAGTSSFYAQFRRSPIGRYAVRVCHGTACHVAGAEQITRELRRHLDIPPDEDTDAQRLFTLGEVACLGCCSLAPVMMIEETTVGRLTPSSARRSLENLEPPA